MSSTDDRVINMEFNNSQFQKGVADSTKSLSDLKKGLNLDSATKSLGGLEDAAGKFNLSNISDGVQKVVDKFNAWHVVAYTVISDITTRAFDAGADIVKSLTVEPITDGLSNYETKINAIQTILANTSAAGTKLSDVTAALAELNKYANLTVYNFADMTKNIGTFTAAGVDLNTSVSSIKGIANLAALSGSSAEQASTAMYQLSQAIAAGQVKLQDWNSVVNAGLGGKVFQNALIEDARVHGIAVDKMIKKDGSFRESLQEGWLTSKVLTDTLSTFTGDLSLAQIKAMGYTDQEAQAILKQGQAAVDSATKIRTITQLMQALKEEVGTAWATIWEDVIGGIGPATKALSAAHNVLENYFTQPVYNLDALLKGFDKLGGRADVIDIISNAWKTFTGILGAVKGAFAEIFPPTTAFQLKAITQGIDDFTRNLIPTQETLDNIKRTAAGVFAVFDIGWQVIKGVVHVFSQLLGAATDGSTGILNFTGNIGDFLVSLDKAIKNGGKLTDFFGTVGDVLVVPIRLLKDFVKLVGSAFDKAKGVDFSGFKDDLGQLTAHLNFIQQAGSTIAKVWAFMVPIFQKVFSYFQPMITAIQGALQGLGDAIKNALTTGDFSGITSAIDVGLFGAILILVKKFMKSLKGGLKLDIGGGLFKSIKEVFGTLNEGLETMQQNIKAQTIERIAIAIGILAAAAVALSLVNSAKLAAALGAIAVMMTELMAAMAAFEKFGGNIAIGRLGAVAVVLTLLATAIDILTIAVVALAHLSWEQLAKGLSALAVLLGEVTVAADLMSRSKAGPKLIIASAGLVALGIALDLLIPAVAILGNMDYATLGKGLVSVGIILGELDLFTQLSKVTLRSVTTGAGLLLLAGAIEVIAQAVSQLGKMSVSQLAAGLSAITIVMTQMTLFTNLVNNSLKAPIAAAGLVVLALAIGILAKDVAAFGSLDIMTLAKGLSAMALALTEIVIALNLIPASGILQAAALAVVGIALESISKAVKSMGKMSWEEIGKGMVVLAGSLLILAAALYAMSGGLPGAAALIVTAGALTLLVPVLQNLGNMTWGEIGTGLGALASALGVLAVAGIALIPAIPGLVGLGVAVGLFGAGMLAAGAGVLALSVGLTALAASGGIAGPVVLGLFQGLIALIPQLLTAVATGIVQMLQVFTDNAPTFLTAIVSLLSQVLTAIDLEAPQILQTISNLLTDMLATVAGNLPNWLQMGATILIEFLQGISNNIGAVVTVASNIIVNFLNGIAANMGNIVSAGTNVIISFINAVSSNAVRIANAGADAVVKFVNGVANSISSHQAAMNAAGRNLAFAIADGMTGGLASKIRDVASGAANLAKQALDAAKSALGIHSPSKEFYAVGEFSADGLVNALSDNTQRVSDTASNVGTTAVKSLQASLSGVGDSLDGNMQLSPTITPVLDLSQVQKTAGTIPSVIGTPTVALDTTATSNKATTVALQTQASQASLDASGAATGTDGSGNIIFQQYNNSPKALSASDVYRQTKNLISTTKDLLGA